MSEKYITYTLTCVKYILITTGAIYTIKAIKDVLLAYNGQRSGAHNRQIKNDKNAANSESADASPHTVAHTASTPPNSKITIQGKNIVVNMKNDSDMNGSMVDEDFDAFVQAMDNAHPSPEPSTDEDLATILDDVVTTDLPDMDDMIFVDQDERSYCPDSDTHEQKSATDRDTPATSYFGKGLRQ